ncbi:MAG: glycosyl hydrolase [Patescibacteria group bacterium]|nr:hypothetical protein [Patescibacteria group bacterium]
MKPPKFTTRFVLFSLVIAVFVVSLIWLYEEKLRPRVKLDTPTELPEFGVSYIYSTTNYSQFLDDAKKDLKEIKDYGFSGIKITFHFKQNDATSAILAEEAAKVGIYPIGQLVGHNSKPLDRSFNSDEMTFWLGYTRNTVKENKDIIYFWEVWNEPDIAKFRYGTPQEYFELLKQTYPVIKEENPNAKVIFAIGCVDKNGINFLNKVLELGGGDYFDILGFHPYAGNPYIREDVFKSSIKEIKEIQKNNNNKWPLWITEIGVPTSEVSEQEQANLGSMVFQKASEENMPVIWFYYSDKQAPGNILESGWGLIREDGTKRPLFEALTEIIK